MYSVNLNNLTRQQFLDEYWQKKPVLIRGALNDFEDPITPDELAGLAMEPSAESRLVSQTDGKWSAEHGPFDSYDHLGEENWSLLIQGVDHWDENVDALLKEFRFMPNWRIDDVMVSFATPGGGVGPHVDNYDVFIIQGSGKRHWQVGSNEALTEVVANEALLHVEAFEPIIDAQLNPGDMLYIPPGFPHQGVAIEPSMSFSVGYRTIAKSHLFSGFADYLIDNQLGKDMVVDPQRQATTTPGLIDQDDISNLSTSLQDMLNDEQCLTDFYGKHLSTAKHELAIEEDIEPFSAEEILDILQEQPLNRLGGLRCLYFPQEWAKGWLYVDGEKHSVSPALHDAIALLADETVLSDAQLAPWLKNNEFKMLVTHFVNQGFWYFLPSE
ncbi:MAG: cupin domain-containing protein [Psychrobium sp.]